MPAHAYGQNSHAWLKSVSGCSFALDTISKTMYTQTDVRNENYV